MHLFDDPSRIDTALDCRVDQVREPDRRARRRRHGRRRAQRARRTGGSRPARRSCSPTSMVRDVRHIWMTFPPAPPEEMRAVVLEVFYDGLERAEHFGAVRSTSSGCRTGGRSAYTSALTAVQEGPASTRISRCRSASTSASSSRTADTRDHLLLPGRLHARARRGRARVSARLVPAREPDGAEARLRDRRTGSRDPGASSGCVVGVRVLPDDMIWYGEGEFKVFRDGDDALPDDLRHGA